MMIKTTQWALAGILLAAGTAGAEEKKSQAIVEHNKLMDHGGGHLMDMDGGMVMGMNKDQLPPGCSRVSEDVSITVRAGRKYSKEFPGTMFGFDTHEWTVKPCTRLNVTFINEDNIRHQWMMHGLPKFIYDKGMFHLEVPGPGKIAGTLILPAEDKTYLVHCDIAQHMEKGMKAQLIVGKGSAPFPSIPGITDPAVMDDYGPTVIDKPLPVKATPGTPPATISATMEQDDSNSSFILGIALGAIGAPYSISWYRRRYAGLSREEALGHLANDAKSLLDKTIGLITTLLARMNRK